MADRIESGIGATAPGHYGAPSTGVTLAEATIAAAWNLQGDATRTAFADAVRRLFGIALPVVPNTTARGDTLTALWLGPNSWLLVAGGASPLVDLAATRAVIDAAGGAVFDVGTSRIAWTVAGAQAATILAKDCPLDFHPRAFAEGACAQSLLGHVSALYWRRDAASYVVMVARSFARDAWHALRTSAAQYGCDVLPAAPLR